MLEEFVDLCRRAVPTPSEHGVRLPFGSRAAVCPACKNVAAHDGRFQLSAVSRLQDPDNPLLAEDTPWDVGPMGIHSSVFKVPLMANGKCILYGLLIMYSSGRNHGEAQKGQSAEGILRLVKSRIISAPWGSDSKSSGLGEGAF